MSSKVLEFPVKKKTAETILARLNAQAENLEEKYVVLDRIHAELHKTEEEADCMESSYNEAMVEYADMVGIENVPKVLLGYASNVRIDVTGEVWIWKGFDCKRDYGVPDAPAQFTLDLFGEDDETER